MRCTRCGAFSNRGLKKNARKETPPDEKYLGIQIVKLSFRCSSCSSEIIIKTDPKNQDYVVVSGAVRNNEPWRNRAAEEESVEQRLDRLEREEAAAKAAFAAARAQVESSAKVAEPEETPIEPQAPAPTFKRAVKKKKDHAAALGLKKKSS